jgi:dCMP deaminase
MRDRPDWDTYFIWVARAVAVRSPDEETQVGCVIVDRAHRIIAAGYNGFPPGFPDEELPATRPHKYPYMVHAEINAMVSSKSDLRGSTLYCTHSPCADCVKAIATAGISTVVYATKYAGFEQTERILLLAKIAFRCVGG